MPMDLLTRRTHLGLPISPVALHSNQILADQSLQQATDALSDPIALAAMGSAPLFGKLGRMAGFAGSERLFGRAACSGAKALGALTGLGVEAGAYEAIQRSLRVAFEGADSSLLQWENYKEAWMHSFVSFGVLKTGNSWAAGSNAIVGHFAADAAMVLSHQALAALGMMPKPSDSMLSQFIQAEAMNWQMKGGMSLFHAAFPALALREKVLDLEFGLRSQSAEGMRRLEPSLASMAAPEGSSAGSASERRQSLRPHIEAHLQRMAAHLAEQVASRRFRRENFLPLNQRIERILGRLYPEQEPVDFKENDRLSRGSDQFHRILESWNARVQLSEVSEILSILEEGLNGQVGALFVEQNVREFCRKHAPSAGSRKPKKDAEVSISAPREIKPYNLRDYQQKMVEALYEDAMSEASPWLGLASPMQTGKSFLAGPAIQRLREVYGPKARFIVLSSAKVITRQVLGDLLEGFNPAEVGRYDASTKQVRNVTVASVHTLVRHLGEFTHDGPTILVNDEAYSTQSPTFRAIYTHFGLGEVVGEGRQSVMKPKAGNGLVVGLSGTGAGLEGYKISGQLNILDAITQGWIRHMSGDRVLLSIPAEKRQSVEEQDMIWWPATESNAEALADIYDQHLHGAYRRNAIFVPTITHAELLRDALRKRHGRDYAFAVHSEMDKRGEMGSLDRDFDRVIEHWEREGGAVISIGQLNRGYRGKGIDACFHTYESSSSELFGQRTGRGWAGTPGEEVPDYYVLEVTWNRRSRFANLARLLGLVDYPFRSFSSRGLSERLERAKRSREDRQILDGQMLERRVAPLFEGIPLLRFWREAFREISEKAGGLNALAERGGLSLEILAGFGLGGLPVHFETLWALRDLLERDAHEFWLDCWREAATEVREGIQLFEERFSMDLVGWLEGKNDFKGLEEVLGRYFPRPKSRNGEHSPYEPASEEAAGGLSIEKPGEERQASMKAAPFVRNEDLDLDPAFTDEMRKKLEIPLYSLPVHWTNGCRRFFSESNFYFVADLVQWAEKDLKRKRGLGILSLNQIKDALQDLGFTLGMEVKRPKDEIADANGSPPARKIDELLAWLREDLGETVSHWELMNLLEKARQWVKKENQSPICHKVLDEVILAENPRSVEELVQELGEFPQIIRENIYWITQLLYLDAKRYAQELAHAKIVEELRQAYEAKDPSSLSPPALAMWVSLNAPLDDYNDYSIRTSNILRNMGIGSRIELLYWRKEKLLNLKNFGKTCLKEIEEDLARFQLFPGQWAETGPGDSLRKPNASNPLSINVDELDLPWRVARILLKNDIRTVGELIQKSEAELLKYLGFGSGAMKEVKAALAGLGLNLNKGRMGAEKDPARDKALLDALNSPVDDLFLSVRSANLLQDAGVRYVGEIIQKMGEMSKMPKFGPKVLMEFKEVLRGRGVSLDMLLKDWKPPTSD